MIWVYKINILGKYYKLGLETMCPLSMLNLAISFFGICNLFSKINNTRKFLNLFRTNRLSVGITVDAPVTAVWNTTNDIQCFKDI